ncbi:MAG: SMP-30/gluconolactonase/LRE family protein [Betaproteobacteria bacterium]
MTHHNRNACEVVWHAADVIGECPVWDSDAQELWWTDIEGRVLHRLHPGSGMHRSVLTDGRVGSFALADHDRLVLAVEHAFAWMARGGGPVHEIAVPEAGLAHHRFNDGGCDPSGRFLAGSMNLERSRPSASLWRLGADLRPVVIAAGVTTANGLAFSPDGTRMWWADSPAQRIFTFDYDRERGVASHQRVWLDEGHGPGRPDGAAIDVDGCYWSARWRGGCVVRFTPDGHTDRIFELPVQQVSACAFGGAQLDTLFVTSARNRLSSVELEAQPLAGAVFAIRSGTQGTPPRQFSGLLPPLPR